MAPASWGRPPEAVRVDTDSAANDDSDSAANDSDSDANDSDSAANDSDSGSGGHTVTAPRQARRRSAAELG